MLKAPQDSVLVWGHVRLRVETTHRITAHISMQPVLRRPARAGTIQVLAVYSHVFAGGVARQAATLNQTLAALLLCHVNAHCAIRA
ncbi:hypothetical protein AURDEDRAFT_112023 [Auricularia subglabra TFB-10046 SS5]|nr:hypothetical protein AURDEDRAFT_112023 [Auricularia subglabra TFB-10046 SS5]